MATINFESVGQFCPPDTDRVKHLKDPYKSLGVYLKKVQCFHTCLFYHFSGTEKNSTVHEITAGHRSLSSTISCVTDRIRFLPVTIVEKIGEF